MKVLLKFETSLTKSQALNVLRDNTFPSGSAASLLFGKQYLSGLIGEDRIRVKNACRDPRSPSAIFEITLESGDNGTTVTIYDNLEMEEVLLSGERIAKTLTVSISVLVVLVGGILSLIRPDQYSFLWTLVIALPLMGIGFIYPYFNRLNVTTNNRSDLDFLCSILKK